MAVVPSSSENMPLGDQIPQTGVQRRNFFFFRIQPRDRHGEPVLSLRRVAIDFRRPSRAGWHLDCGCLVLQAAWCGVPEAALSDHLAKRACAFLCWLLPAAPCCRQVLMHPLPIGAAGDGC